MEAPVHSMNALFAQLGLAADDAAINAFIAAHGPLRGDARLAEASFWSPSQREMLRNEVCVDADWAGVIDQLDARLRGHA
ncbi:MULTISPECIES: DUF2789 domain-containing protein [Uliginosibacterium]|uniref:DUF2789 domain-containing protein n=1 Tax=Uliginosibacterium aquaticum TaxID=2731212 RepID=A0ABX2ID01_9RHOO|nr:MULTISPECIES: DUF2789 domain-containing protein [Uliginosibacterium]MDO6387030.1 DUF2789 domain-containing protein [Uliginosibacterium sp. 31-12]NSL54421.1 DUF2789 domain-containing protein [Uliginosibacterium aquaticum]PLK50169.1 DUF2789 domain-containing protein [Uliginosibacterium sp. TH139]